MAQSTKVLLLQGGPGFELRAHRQMLGGLWRILCTCNPRNREMRMGGTSGVPWPASIASLASSKQAKEPVSKENKKRWRPGEMVQQLRTCVLPGGGGACL